MLHTVGQLRDLEALARRRQSSLDFHLEFDSGMGRMGIEEARAGEVADVLAAAPYLRLEGLATHFASAENMASGQTEEQLLRFNALVSKLSARGVRPPFIHMANSAALAYRADTWGTMVRPGLALYGYVMPSEGGQVQPVIHPAPILTWKAQIIAIKQYGAGVPLGYNASFTTPRPMRVGVLGVGYGDGLDRRLSNGGSVLAKGRLAPIVGLISMDVSLVDLSSSPEVVEGEYVTLLGAEGGLKQDALDLAAHCRTIPYEILCGISRRAPRIYR
ncbi:MAG: alanine racemase [Acidobacteria bacterium]|nr:alanine racemase [Acidobacteriota bacterium]